jgi:hypothetical protein
VTRNRYIVTRGGETPPAGSTLVYEGEWNEGADPSEQRDAMTYFAAQNGLPYIPSDVPTVGENDALWITP